MYNQFIRIDDYDINFNFSTFCNNYTSKLIDIISKIDNEKLENLKSIYKNVKIFYTTRLGFKAVDDNLTYPCVFVHITLLNHILNNISYPVYEPSDMIKLKNGITSYNGYVC